MNTATANKEHTTKKMSTRQMTFIALMTAVTCILGPLSIPLPFSPVPISFTNLAIYLSLYVLGLNGATISYLVYLLIGMVGDTEFHGEVLIALRYFQADVPIPGIAGFLFQQNLFLVYL